MRCSTIPQVCGVYLLTDTVTGRTYIGASTNIRKRIRTHFHDMIRRSSSSTYRGFSATYRDLGPDAFDVAVLCECSGEELLEREREFIGKLRPTENSYKRADGKEWASAGVRQKKSDATAKLWTDPSYREKSIAVRSGKAYNKGYVCTPEQVENRRMAARISHMKRKFGDRWKEEYASVYSEHVGDLDGR